MEFKFLKLRDLQGKTPSFPAAGEVHIIYVPEPDNSNLHKAGAGRAMIREILSYYLCIDKGLVCLHESRHGKPYLASPAIGRNLYFNISHTGGYLAFAMSTSTPLGIDIEKVDRNVVKGLGTGMTTSFTSFYLTKESERTFYVTPDKKELQDEYSSWRITSILAPKGFICSVAYRLS